MRFFLTILKYNDTLPIFFLSIYTMSGVLLLLLANMIHFARQIMRSP